MEPGGASRRPRSEVDDLLRASAAPLLMLSLASGAALAADALEAEAVSATLSVRLAAGKSTYFLGETIPLELEFRGRAAPDFYFSTASVERRPGGHERFVVTPEEAVEDPLNDYFSSFGFVGSILSSWHPLDGTPLVLRAELNQWLRFTRPGAYDLSVVSRRLERYSRAPAPELTSNTVAFDVVEPPRGWARSQLARARSALSSGTGDERGRAVRELQYLNTRDAAVELVRHYGEGGDELQSDWASALMASAFRREIVSAMESRLEAGGVLPAGFIGELAKLRALLDHGAGQAHARERFEAELALRCDYTRRWIEHLDRRPSAPALAAAMTGVEAGGECASGLPDLLARQPVLARQAFASLPPERQAILLRFGWPAIAGTWAVPAIEDAYRRSTPGRRFPSPGDEALRRIGALDPERGRSLAIEELRTGAHEIGADTLLSLLPDPLPGLDEALLARYRDARTDDARATAMWLVSRHGSPSLEPLVRGALERDTPCELEAAGLAYLLDHHPEAALARLDPGFDRQHGGCVAPPWDSLAARRWDPRVEAAAIAHVERGTTRQVADAARVLQQHGSAAAKEPLLAGLARWNGSWRARGAELAALAAGPPGLDSPLVVENALTNALANARSFKLSADEAARVRGLCLTRACRDNVDALTRARATQPEAPDHP